MTKQQKGFEERLLTELRGVVAAGVPSRVEPEPRRYGWKPRLVAVAGVAAALAAGLAIGLPGGGDAAAYSVEQNANGTVTVEIKALQDAEGLERKLREAGIPALVQYLPPGRTCKEGMTVGKSHAGSVATMVQGFANGRARFTIEKSEMRPGQTLVIRTQELAPGQRLPVPNDLPEGASLSTNGGPPPGNAAPKGAVSVGVGFEDGPVQPCEVVDA